MTYDAGPTVTFHRTDEGHLAARLEEYAMIAFPASDDLICFCRPYAFPRDQAITLRVVTETWPGFQAEHARLLLAKSLPYQVDGETLIFAVPDSFASTAASTEQEAER
ncbi:hypothetical protein [Mesorhizobium australicum]|uniref:Uncharacterized protein n=1 Tax=Mesorhizobium australicum TaxID=536018 RepID=A0A1X7MQ46_9HYPH|nr:hypothetical protein [Mesorhizobium australicum]SMH26471.1 hypothetical protein SAMN02982922_0266 [Mesorhizobium australicum]